ncbi:MFS transporter [Mycolicibacterium sp.]|uniref:MFS transporter n=1 Tax=Mycolicibacterium sp. TaxID=2320850 RepID=UPI003D1307D1
MSSETATNSRPPVTAAVRRRAVAAAAVGNAIEWYDYTIYGYLAVILGAVFFPSDDPATSLLATFAAFALAFVIRPIGGMVFGSLGDRLGRQRTLATVVVLISAATFLVGVLPGYAVIGVWAPVLLVALRVVQGLSAGGEVGGATAFLAEYAPDRKRALQVAWLNMSAVPGCLAGALLVTVLMAALPPESMSSWGWRVPFLLAGPLGIAGLYLRLKIEDTPEFKALVAAGEVKRITLRQTISGNASRIVLCGAMAVTHVVGFYLLLAYIPNFLATTHGYARGGALMSTMVALVVALCVLPLTAALSDRVGRRPLMAAAGAGYLVFAYPIFMLLADGGVMQVVLAQALLGALFGTYAGAPFAAMIELFSTRVRYTAFSVGYNLSVALFGGTAPMIAAWLLTTTGVPTAPAFYVMFAAIVALSAAAVAPETARVPMNQL